MNPYKVYSINLSAPGGWRALKTLMESLYTVVQCPTCGEDYQVMRDYTGPVMECLSCEDGQRREWNDFYQEEVH